MKAVVVTTEHRGVFFGYVNGEYDRGKVIDLKSARMCIYWSADLRGVIGLAVTGPNYKCRISPAADATIQDVTGVWDCSETATSAWERAPWMS
jgi:hypothetical protein